MGLPISIVEEYNSGITTTSLAKKYNCSVTTVSKYLKKYGVKVINKKYYMPEWNEWLKQNVKGKSYQEITDLFNATFGTNKTLRQITSQLKNLDLKNGLDGTFKKGQEPFNKGLKWDDYMSKEGQEKSRKTQFNSQDRTINNSNHNEVPVGTEIEDKNGYIMVKIDTPQNKLASHKYWIHKHILIYEQHNGKVPKGYKVIFADGNNRNFDIDNLVLVSNGELAIMNKYGLYYKGYAELTKAGSDIAKLHMKVKERKKK